MTAEDVDRAPAEAREQGLPDQVEDAAVLAAVARLIGATERLGG
jgi:hypothetical protein